MKAATCAVLMAMAGTVTATATAARTTQSAATVTATEAGKGSGTNIGPVSPTLAQGWYEEDHEAWGDLPDSRFVNVPNWLVGVTALVPSHRLEAKTLIAWHCPKKSTIRTHKLEVCDAFVFLYRCPPCVVQRAQLEQQLVADGWSHSGCGLDFKTGVDMGNGYSHRMMVLRKQFAAGTSISFTTPNKVIDFAAFGSSSFGVDCSTRTDENTCERVEYGACAWDSKEKECVHTNFCRRPKGPVINGFPKCLVCPLEELAGAPVHPPAPKTR